MAKSNILDIENAEAARLKALTEEERNQGVKHMAMDGMELTKVIEDFEVLANTMAGGVPTSEQGRFSKWRTAMKKALDAFNKGAALALADIWHEDKSAEMGEHFRTWFDTVVDEMGPEVGLPYLGREYVNILPCHWLAEPDHLPAPAQSTE